MHRELVERWIEWWNTGDTAIADSIYAPGYVRHAADTPGRGPGPIKELVLMFRAAFADLHYVVEDVVEDGDRVAVRWRATATHTGELYGIPPTGKSGALDGCDILRIADGRIVESWPFYDRLTMLELLRSDS